MDLGYNKDTRSPTKFFALVHHNAICGGRKGQDNRVGKILDAFSDEQLLVNVVI